MLRGQFLNPGAMKAPGYPIFLAFARLVSGGRIYAAILLQCLAGAAVAAIAAYLGARFFGERAGIVAGVLVALDPASILIANCLLSDIPFTFLILLGAWLTLRSFDSPGLRWPLVAGFVFILATLARPIGAFAPFLAAPFLFFADRAANLSPRRRLVRLALFLSPWILGVLAWAARGADLSRFQDAARLFDWYLISLRETNAGKLLRGIAALLFESGSSLFAEILGLESKRVVLLSDSIEGGTIGAIRQAFVGRPWPQLAFVAWTLAVLSATYAGVLACVRSARAARPRVAIFYLIATALALVAVSSLWGTMRYRVPIMPFFAIFAGAGLVKLADVWNNRRRRA
ncbi:MAG: ArnT family glycosyltransferase [bacterium]